MPRAAFVILLIALSVIAFWSLKDKETQYLPILVSPLNGEVFTDEIPTLEWEWQGNLAADEFFWVQIWRSEAIPTYYQEYVKETNLELKQFWEVTLEGTYYWEVALVAQDENNNSSQMRSGWSHTGMFIRLSNSRPTYEEINPLHLETDPAQFIDLHTQQDVIDMRDLIRLAVFGKTDLNYERLPDRVTSLEGNSPYISPLNEAEVILELEIEMELGFVSTAFHLIPPRSNNQLVIYHRGHEFANINDFVIRLLDQNYEVIILDMPGYGANVFPILIETNLGRLNIANHDDMALLDRSIETGSAMKFFLEPITIALNYADQRKDYDRYIMVGLSGGGWASTVYPAIDERIQNSYSIAGTTPAWLRLGLEGLSDYEQSYLEIHHEINYTELYILAAAKRRHWQFYNQYDNCCHYGLRSQLYVEAVEKRLAALGEGFFGFYIDPHNRIHSISDQMGNMILKDLAP